MGQFSVEKSVLPGSALSGNQHYIVRANRGPQSTLAWMLLFLMLPGLALLVYLLFGRDRKAFSREHELALQNLQGNKAPLLGPIRARQDIEIRRLEVESPVQRRLMQLVRHNSHSILTTRNRVTIQQDAAVHYPGLIEDLKSAEVRSTSNITSGRTIPLPATSKKSCWRGLKTESRCAFSMIPSGHFSGSRAAT